MRKLNVYAIQSDNKVLSFINGTLRGDRHAIQNVKTAVALKTPTQLFKPHGEYITPSLETDDGLGILAALLNGYPGRSKIIAAPEHIQDLLDEMQDNNTEYPERNAHV